MKSHSFNKKEESLLNLALELKSKSRYKESLDILIKIHEKHGSNSSVVNGLLGSVYYEQKEYKKSAIYFRKATILNPKSELASLGMFHSLIETGKDDLALEEMKRYLHMFPPNNYKVTIKELYEESDNILSKETKKLVDKYYKKYTPSSSFKR